MSLLFPNPLSLTHLFLPGRKGRKGKHGNERRGIHRQLESGEAVKTQEEENEQHSRLDPIFGRTEQELHFESGMGPSLVQWKDGR